MKKIPNPMRAPAQSLMQRAIKASTTVTELIALKGRDYPANKEKIDGLTTEYAAIGMDTATLEGFTLPTMEPVPTEPADKTPSAAVALFLNGMRVIGANLGKIHGALVTYEAGLVDTEVEGEDEAQAEPPPAAEAPPPPPAEEAGPVPPPAEPPPADGPPREKGEGEPEAPPPPKAEAPKADPPKPPPAPEPPPVPPADEAPKPPPADDPRRARWGSGAPDAPPPAAEPPPRAEEPRRPRGGQRAEPPPPPAAKATEVTPEKERYKWWEIGCGVFGLLALIALAAGVIMWIGPTGPVTPPSAPQPAVTVAPTPAPTPAPKPTPPAPAPVAPATPTASSALDCSLAVPMPDGDMDQDGETEDYVLLTVHGGKSSLWVEGWTSDGTNCKAGGNTVTNGDFDSLRKGLKKALGSNAPNEGVTNPVTVQGHKVMCDIGQGPVNNCFEG